MAADNQMDPDELGAVRAHRRGRRVRLREGRTGYDRRGVREIPKVTVLRQRDPVAVHQDRLRVLAHRRLAGRLRRDLARGPGDAAARPAVPATGSRRRARPPERRHPEGARPAQPVPSTASASGRASGCARSCRPSARCCSAGSGGASGPATSVRDFHPLVFFYTFGAILTTLGLLLGLLETIHRIGGTQVPTATIVLVALLVISGFQSLLLRDVVRHGLQPVVGLTGSLLHDLLHPGDRTARALPARALVLGRGPPPPSRPT